MQPCNRFAVLDSRRDERESRCDVCGHLERDHEQPGRQRMTGGEIEALRRRLIIERYDKLEEQQPRSEDDRAI